MKGWGIMARIIIYGDIDISPLYIRVDGGKELKIESKCPRSITVSTGTHHVFATTVSKLERAAEGLSDGGFMDTLSSSMIQSTNTTLSGELDFGSGDVLLIQVTVKGVKTEVINKLMTEQEADDYVYMDQVRDYTEKEPGQKNKWVALLLCFFFGAFGVHRFYERKIGTGILYLLTLGLFGFGVLIDFFAILFRKS